MTVKKAAYLVSLLLLPGLAGCSMTVFESLPAGTATQCDPAWPGHWQRLPRDGQALPPDPAPLEILPGCRGVIADGEEKPLDLTLIDVNGRQYLRFQPGKKPDCAGKDDTHCGLLLFRYEREGDTVRLYEPDHAWVAAAIRRGDIEGYSAPAPPDQATQDKPVHRNFVAGDAARIAMLLERHPFFGNEPLIVVRRVTPATPAAGQSQDP